MGGEDTFSLKEKFIETKPETELLLRVNHEIYIIFLYKNNVYYQISQTLVMSLASAYLSPESCKEARSRYEYVVSTRGGEGETDFLSTGSLPNLP